MARKEEESKRRESRKMERDEAINYIRSKARFSVVASKLRKAVREGKIEISTIIKMIDDINVMRHTLKVIELEVIPSVTFVHEGYSLQ
jgi:hypothetical protein